LYAFRFDRFTPAESAVSAKHIPSMYARCYNVRESNGSRSVLTHGSHMYSVITSGINFAHSLLL